MKTRREALTQSQLDVIRLLVTTGCSMDNAGKQVGRTRFVIQKWMKDERFKAGLAEARAEQKALVWARIEASAQLAADTIVAIAADPKEKGSVRLMASQTILDRGGFKTPEAVVDPGVYSTRDDLVNALALVPPDVLADAIAKAAKGTP